MNAQHLFTVTLVLAAGACERPPAIEIAAEREALMRLSREWSQVAGGGDLEGALAYWAEDAVMMPPGMPPVRGKAAIREYVNGSGSIPNFRIRWEPLEAHVAPSGELAYLIERNEIRYQDSTGAPILESNKVVTIWRKEQDGSWKNVVDMWNADPEAWSSK